MIYKYILPRPVLQEFVRDYLVTHLIFDKNQPIPFKPYAPKPEQGITFFVKGFVTIVDEATGQSTKAPKISIFGQQISRYNFHLTSEYLMVRLHFHPGALYRLFGIPLSEFTDQYCDATALISSEVEQVNAQLQECSSYAQMIEKIEFYLIAKLTQVKKDSISVDRIASCMLGNPNKFSLDFFANQACLSPRQFNRLFTERIGIGPKLYSRIIRFCKAYEYKEKYPRTDWLSIAMLFDYSDYQHLSKDFRQFAGAAPNFWIDEDNQSPERILNL